MPPKKQVEQSESSESETDIDDVDNDDIDNIEETESEEDEEENSDSEDIDGNGNEGNDNGDIEKDSGKNTDKKNDEDVDTIEEPDDCMYNFKENNILDDEEFDEQYDDDDIVYDEIVSDDDRITKPTLSIYERVRILGDRARQLLEGAKPMIKGVEKLSPKEIAQLELEKKVIPFKLIRELPNGKKEKWRISELNIGISK